MGLPRLYQDRLRASGTVTQPATTSRMSLLQCCATPCRRRTWRLEEKWDWMGIWHPLVKTTLSRAVRHEDWI